MNYILGIDQGSSNTRAAVSDETGNLIGYFKTEGACHSIHGMDKAMGLIRDASLGALRMAGLGTCDVSILYSGMTGADFPDEYELLHDEIVNLQICKHVVVKNDCIAALRGGTMENYGAIVAAGSGCNCAIISPTGEEFIYQYFVEDAMQGGGAFSRKIIDAIYQAETFRVPETRLTNSVLKKLGFPDVMTLLRNDVEKKITPNQRLGIVPIVFEDAFAGDEVAESVIREMAIGMAQLIKGGVLRFNLQEVAFDVVISGSIFKGKGPLLIETFSDEVHRCAPKATIINAVFEPVVGAVLLGIEQIAKKITPGILENIQKSSIRFQLKR